ncbi:MAG: T9SS type A sorting domain-containing protein [Flavobacteriales bacterium]
MRTFHFVIGIGIACSTQAALSVQVGSTPEVCGYGNGMAYANAYGGVAPYTYVWSNSGTTQQITGLLPGVYDVTVTDNVGTQISGSTTVGASGELLYAQYSTMPTCPGQCSGTLVFDKAYFGGTPPYTYSVTPAAEDASTVTFGGVCWYAEQGTVTITDVNGCSVDAVLGVSNAYSAQVQFLQFMPSCQGSQGYVVFQLDYVMTTILRVYNDQFNEVYTDFAPPADVPITVPGLAPGNYTIHSISTEIPGEWCYNEYTFTIDDLGTDCGRVMGDLYVDADDDCVFDVMEETGMPYRMITVEPGPVFGITGATGHYMINLPEGSYTLADNDPDLFPICPAIEPAPFDITLPAPVVILDLADSSSVGPDLQLSCVHSEARPGFTYHVWLTIKNLSPYFAGSPNLLLTYDPLLTFQSSSYPLYTLSPGQVTWPGMYFLPGFDTRTIHLQFLVPPDQGLIGTQFTSTGFVQQTPLEPDETNNTCTETVTITGSYDPNDKTATTSSGLSATQYFLGEDTCVTYVVRFQNTGTATAINVEITDTLPPELDPGTMRLLGWSHPLSAVEITDGPVMHWHFNNINLPDSGANEAASHGFVSFRMLPREPLLVGTVISNTANIYFDFNDPVITESSVLVVDINTGVEEVGGDGLILFPNPAHGSVTIRSTDGAIASVRVLAADGRILYSRGASQSVVTVDMSVFAPGIYFALVRLSDGRMTRTSFVLN